MWPNLQFPADLVTFTEEILNGKLHFLWSEIDTWEKVLICDKERWQCPSFQKILVFSKIIFLKLLDPNQTIFLTSAILKELRNIAKNYFCVRHKNSRKHNQRFRLLFFHAKFTLWPIEINTYMSEIEIASHK